MSGASDMEPAKITARRAVGRRHSPHLDALRIIAAAGIVILHYANYMLDTATGKSFYAHIQHFNLFVDLFFVISGFVIASQYLRQVESAEAIRRFLWRRLARIYPLHLLTLIFYVGIAILFAAGKIHVENPERYALSDFPAQLLLLHAIDGQRLTFNFPSWSLSAEMVCYLLFPLVAAVGLRRPRLVLVFAFVAAALLTFYSAFFSVESWPHWINQGGAWRAIPAFFLGVGLYLYRATVARLPLRMTLTPALILFPALGWLIPDLAAAALVYFVVAAAVHCDAAHARTLLARSNIGRWAHLTFSTYMLHMPVATLAITLLGRFVGNRLPSTHLALIAGAVTILIVTSIAVHRFVEEPVRQGLNAAFDRRQRSASLLAMTPPGGMA